MGDDDLRGFVADDLVFCSSLSGGPFTREIDAREAKERQDHEDLMRRARQTKAAEKRARKEARKSLPAPSSAREEPRLVPDRQGAERRIRELGEPTSKGVAELSDDVAARAKPTLVLTSVSNMPAEMMPHVLECCEACAPSMAILYMLGPALDQGGAHCVFAYSVSGMFMKLSQEFLALLSANRHWESLPILCGIAADRVIESLDCVGDSEQIFAYDPWSKEGLRAMRSWKGRLIPLENTELERACIVRGPRGAPMQTFD